MLQQLSNMRGKVVICMIGALFFCYWANGAWVKKVHYLERKIHMAFGQYRATLDLRAQVLPQLIELLKNYAPQEQALSQELSKHYEEATNYQRPEQILSDPKLALDYLERQKALIDSVAKTHKVVQRYPSLAQNRQYFLILNQWHELNQNVSGKEVVLNSYIKRYNSYLEGFPQGLYNRISYQFNLKIPSQLPDAT